MKRLVFLLFVPFLLGATLSWDPVTVDITGAPETVSVYRCYARKAGTLDAWVRFAETPANTTTLPSPSAKMEYVCSAVDLAGKESDQSISVTAKPETPRNLQVVR